MPTRNRTAGQCIFCAFKSQTPWSLRCSGNGASHQVRLRSELIPRPNEDGLATYRPSFLPPPNGEVAQTYRPSFLSALSENESSAKGKKPNLRVAKRRVDLFESIKAVDRNHAVARGHVSLKELKRLSNRTSSSGELREKTRLGDLKKIIREQLPKTEKALAQSLLVKSLELDEDSLAKQFSSFRHKVEASFSVDVDGRVANSENLYATLRQVYIERGEEGLDAQLKYAFYGHVAGSRFTKSDIQNQKEMADLRYPAEWFPATRRMHRTIHLHVGPTNSGKTYHALKRLEEADSGVYAGPLRLLAHEVYTRMNAKGKRCTLVTGEERRIPDENADFTTGLSSCTVEMVPLNRIVDVAVIDEIQMINNPERGWAWTQALLGVRATELHLCGEDRTVPLIRELAAAVGDKLEIHRYERLSPLKMMRESLDGDLKKLRKGDCVVSFSVMGIHALRKEIERTTGRKVAIVYGSLPPETRAQQARLFNDPDNEYDYLVASDAIGMGLNLSIKRIIFETSQRFNGYERQTLKVADIKQIAGRAGRYRTAAQATQDTASEAAQDLSAAKGESAEDVAAAPNASATEDLGTVRLPRPPRSQNVGYVTTLEKFDFPIVDTAMKSEPEPIMTAGLFPPAAIIERFASYFPPETPFGYILLRLHEISLVHPRFYLCGLKDQLSIADVIQPVKNLTTNDRIIFCAAPAAIRDENGKTLLKALAHCVAEQKGGVLLDIPEFKLDVLDREPSRSREYLGALESLHKGLVLYLWLSYRFAGVFNTRPLAFHVKGLVEDAIENALSKFSYNEMTRQRLRVAREKNVLKNLKTEIALGEAAQERRLETNTPLAQLGLDSEPKQEESAPSSGDHFSGEADTEILEPMEDEGLGGESVNMAQNALRTSMESDPSAESADESVSEVSLEEESQSANALNTDTWDDVDDNMGKASKVSAESAADVSAPSLQLDAAEARENEAEEGEEDEEENEVARRFFDDHPSPVPPTPTADASSPDSAAVSEGTYPLTDDDDDNTANTTTIVTTNNKDNNTNTNTNINTIKNDANLDDPAASNSTPVVPPPQRAYHVPTEAAPEVYGADPAAAEAMQTYVGVGAPDAEADAEAEGGRREARSGL